MTDEQFDKLIEVIREESAKTRSSIPDNRIWIIVVILWYILILGNCS